MGVTRRETIPRKVNGRTVEVQQKRTDIGEAGMAEVEMTEMTKKKVRTRMRKEKKTT